jgi:hypothetical protein
MLSKTENILTYKYSLTLHIYLLKINRGIYSVPIRFTMDKVDIDFSIHIIYHTQNYIHY